MARLYLIRHAQASFGADDYDNLSAIGSEQSTHIPKHFQQPFQQLYRGSMKRHEQTASIAFKDFESTIMDGLNEFDHKNVLAVHRPEINDKAAIMQLVASQANPKKFLEDEFEMAMVKWIHNRADGYTEPFANFNERVEDALNNIIQQSLQNSTKEIAVVTSGGVISLIVAKLLELPYEKMIPLNLGIVNTSVTCLLFNQHKTSLSYYNNHSHLPSALVTRI